MYGSPPPFCLRPGTELSLTKFIPRFFTQSVDYVGIFVILKYLVVFFFYQIFVPHENRSQIDEIYNKTNIMKLQKLCNKVTWVFLVRLLLKRLEVSIDLRFDPKIYLSGYFSFCMQNLYKFQTTNIGKHFMVLGYQRLFCKGTQLSMGSRFPCLMSLPLKQDRNIQSSDFNLQGPKSD